MSPTAIVERETRWAPYAAAGGFLAVFFFVLAQVMQGSVALGTGTVPQALRQLDANSGLVTLGGVVGGLGLLAMMAPLVFLFRAAQARSPRVAGGLIGLAVLGPLFYAIQYGVGAIGRAQVASDYVAKSHGVGDIYTLSTDLFDDSKLVQFAGYVGAAGSISLVVIVIYTGLWATRTGLLTRFTGTLGMALGASTLIASFVALPALSVWFAYVGAVILDKVPRGRPPAWDAGEALAPLKPGEAPVPAGGASDVIEGDATEIPGVGENQNAARRERARKRKRKRRR